MRKATDVEIHSLCHYSYHVQSGEKIGTRKKRKEHMRKATDVETKTRTTLKTFGMNYIKEDTNSTNP